MPMIDIAYVPTMCNHCDDAPCMAKGGDADASKRDDGIVIIDPAEGEGAQGPGRSLPLRPHLVERGAAAAADLAVRRPPHRPGLAADPRPAGLPDRRHARDQGRGRRDGAHGARGGPRSDEAGAGTRPRVYYRNLWRYSKCFIGGSLSAEANGVVDCVEGASVRLLQGRPHRRRDDERQLRRFQIRPARREFRHVCRRDFGPGPRQEDASRPASAQASISARSGYSSASRRHSAALAVAICAHAEAVDRPRTRLAVIRAPPSARPGCRA